MESDQGLIDILTRALQALPDIVVKEIKAQPSLPRDSRPDAVLCLEVKGQPIRILIETVRLSPRYARGRSSVVRRAVSPPQRGAECFHGGHPASHRNKSLVPASEPDRLLYGVSVEVVRKVIKNLHLSVYPPNGRARVAAPLAVDDGAVRLAVIGKLAWIKRQRARFA